MKAPVGLIGAIVVALFAVNLVSFTVNEVEQVIVTQFGEPIRVIDKPGLYFKLPDPMQKTTRFERWLLDYDSTPEPIYTKDKKILRAIRKYRATLEERRKADLIEHGLLRAISQKDASRPATSGYEQASNL